MPTRLILEFNNPSKSPLKVSFVKKIAKNTLAAALDDMAKEKKISLSFAIVTEEEIKKYNKNYRHKNKPTDILTFCEFKDGRQVKKALAVEKEIFLGESLLCYNDIKRYCRQNRKDITKELAEVISHGVLHMLGFQHGKKMFAIQKKIAGE